MSLSFNSAKYQELLAEYQPKLIKTEAENDRYCRYFPISGSQPTESSSVFALLKLGNRILQRQLGFTNPTHPLNCGNRDASIRFPNLAKL